MYSWFLEVAVVSIFPLLASAAPLSIDVVTLPIPTQLGFPGPSTTVTLTEAVSFVNERSADIASMVGMPVLLGIEATLGLLEASNAIGTATQLTAFITDVSSTPIVQVSSIGGEAITLATGTVGDKTTFGGQVFTAAPQNNGAANENSAGGNSAAAPTTSDGGSSQSPTAAAANTPSAAADNVNTNGAGNVMVPRSLFVGAAVMLGSMAAGAMVVL